jgi:cation diffusion facilitator CzcD-associated flavoprotein CzcO
MRALILQGGRDRVTKVYKIAIVGSGPAGLSAAARAAQIGLDHVLLEKTDHLSDTIYKYQKGKHVMATPAQLVLRSDCDFDAGKRETILGIWDKQAAEQGVNVMYNAEVKAITGEKGAFKLALTNGDQVEAQNVILAIGTQGNPNTMRVPGGDLPHIQYQLDDPANMWTSISPWLALATRASRMRSAWRRTRSRAMSSPSSIAGPTLPAPRAPTSSC